VSSAKNAVRVTIGGEELTVRSELPPEYTREVAAYLDAALKRVRDSLPSVDVQKAAILAALAITDELFQARRGDREIANRMTALADDLARLLPSGQARQALGRLLTEIPMPRDLLLPTLAGVAAGLVVALLAVALWIRRQRRAADGIVATAQKEGTRIRTEAARDAESAKTEMLVGARMETLKLREELDREVQRRREEWERGERRAEERSRAHDRKVERWRPGSAP
jgi:cell division protein ZapA (FtsZ GTPase activity inhibitor)